MKKFLCGMFLALGLTGLVGCTGEVAVAAPEATVEAVPAVSSEVVTYSYETPPAPVVEVIPVAPSPRHVWCEGHWYWTGARYTWVRGYWDYRPGYRYYRGGWARVDGRWHYRPAYWGRSGHWRRR